MSAREDLLIELEGFALELAHTAGGIAQAYFRSNFAVDNKNALGFDPVTSADRAIENVLRESIQSAYPDHGIVAEEFGNKAAASEFCWYIDPIDGTRSFLMGSPLWGTLVGLTHRGRPMFGLLAQPVLEEVFFGSPGGSWLIAASKRTRLKSSGCRELGRARLASTDPWNFSGHEQPAFERLAEACLLDRYGGDCYNYAMLAAGFVDLVVESRLKPFDIVPLIPVLLQAGCVVSSWTDGSVLEGGNVVAAASAELHAATLAILNG